MKKCKRHQKDIHPSSLSAIKSALRCSKKRGTPLRPYFDHDCRCWHITKQPRKDWTDEASAA